MKQPRYSIGIDLGTTNCVLSYVDTEAERAGSRVLPIPQLQSLQAAQTSPTLPSFYYFATDAEAQQGQLNPWSPLDGEASVVGAFAREQMNALPGRVIHSAKSWLSHSGIDRETKLLPFGSEEVPPQAKLSPVEASAAYLSHLKEAWNRSMAEEDEQFSRQRITITVPASFDEAAQALTRKAAELAGYPETLRLLEEPQAAFYAWLESVSEPGSPGARFLRYLPAAAERDQMALVCDIGGGTSDFSLFRISGSDRKPPSIERIAVSDHLLLGGDNIDLALAHLIEKQLKPGLEGRLGRRQWNHLVPQARALKERILGRAGEGDEVFHVSIPGEGANIFQSALTTTITRSVLREVVLDGFFPLTPREERPRMRQIGLRELGLPYAFDTAVSRHLAGFLEGRSVDAVLLAGGALQPHFLRQRLLDLIEAWQGQRPAFLSLEDMSLAIARGASYFGALRSGSKNRIRGGYARSVYLELHRDEPLKTPDLVCILPQGFEEGGQVKLSSHSFSLLLNKPARFTAFTSNRRPEDRPGTIVSLSDKDFHPLPPLYATLTLDADRFNPRTATESAIAVQLEAALTELGVLQLSLGNEEQRKRWRLEFNLRKGPSAGAPASPAAEGDDLGVPRESFRRAVERIGFFYGKKQALEGQDKAKSLMKDLERLFGKERAAWSLLLLRSLWPSIYPGITRRGRSLAHENTWFYLAGFTLRPGYGAELDPWRVSQLWGCQELGITHKKEKSAQSNWWMMWRRVAGGLSAEQQEILYRAALPQLKKSPAEFSEGTRLLGALERIPVALRTDLAEFLFDYLIKGKGSTQPQVFWALSRLLSRVPLYTSAESVIPPEVVEENFKKLESLEWRKLGLQPLVQVFSSACRLTGNRDLDVHDVIRVQVVEKLSQCGAKEQQLRVVQELCEVSGEDRNYLFGEELPVGLRLIEH